MDNKIVQLLLGKFPEVGIKSEKLEDIDRKKYEQLQSLVAKEIKEVVDHFDAEIYPVQYDDIMFRRLNR
jgi:RNA-binding protein YlmH